MADEENAGQVDLAAKRMGGRRIPRSDLLHVLEMNDGAGIVLAEVGAVEEIGVDGGGDDAVRCQQLAQVQVTRSGVLERIVIAVREHGQWKWASPTRHAHVPIERNVSVE